MIRTSVRVRLTAWFSGILGLTLVVAGIGVRLGIQDSIHDTVDKDLRSRLAGMRAYLEKQTSDPDSGPLSEELEEQDSMTPAGSRIRIAAIDGNWIYQSEALGRPSFRSRPVTPEWKNSYYRRQWRADPCFDGVRFRGHD
jgi:hypothetical protein